MTHTTQTLVWVPLMALVATLPGCFDNPDYRVDGISGATLTDDEFDDVQQLREEEKLARDLFSDAYAHYGLPVFNDIARSEQQHMDVVLKILDSYGMIDSATERPGKYNNWDIQGLYDGFATAVRKSKADALLAGAAVQDMEIEDIGTFLSRTAQSDIAVVYKDLLCESRNHLRTLSTQITRSDSTYPQQYISQGAFDDIVATAAETCGK